MEKWIFWWLKQRVHDVIGFNRDTFTIGVDDSIFEPQYLVESHSKHPSDHISISGEDCGHNKLLVNVCTTNNILLFLHIVLLEGIIFPYVFKDAHMYTSLALFKIISTQLLIKYIN